MVQQWLVHLIENLFVLVIYCNNGYFVDDMALTHNTDASTLKSHGIVAN